MIATSYLNLQCIYSTKKSFILFMGNRVFVSSRYIYVINFKKKIL